jgi:hypothetical protein
MAIIRIWTGTAAPAISVARTAVWFQSVTTSARATCVADNMINAAKKRVAAQLAVAAVTFFSCW